MGKGGTATAPNTSGGDHQNNTGSNLGVTEVNNAGNGAVGAEGENAAGIDAAGEDGGDNNDELDTQQQRDGWNGDLMMEFIKSVTVDFMRR